ncbi:hypothetical protein COB11_06120 [Candidatus Aerophobetes bacterium]|uniref:Uncharacterized protein n=1 Tax=Aerophobetes bacterium TaxID=2030807 RepID=A0A2A4YDT3_UNCAE|nr:MAG: hypothetical protein COB11_06120 [Candidatus Aerophobetes bacterium]
MRRLFSVFCFLLPVLSFAEASYELMIDRYMSPYAGAEDLLTLYRSVEKKEDMLLPPKDLPSRRFWPTVGRWAELSLFWDPLARLTVTLQHELFGHGYRVRSLKDTQFCGIKVDWPLPYGASGGATGFNYREEIKASDILSVVIAGSESEYILANTLNSKWTSDGTIDARVAKLYTNTKLGTLQYAYATKQKDVKGSENSGNDIISYIRLVNAIYPDDHMSLSKVRKAMRWNLVDATIYNAMFASWYYIFTGKKSPHWMIPLGKELYYLPSISTHLAPYGIEYSFDNYLRYKDRAIFAYFKSGSYAGLSYGGFGLQYDEMFKFSSVSYGIRLHTFLQPRFTTSLKLMDLEKGKKPSPKARANLESLRPGGALSIISKYRINDTYTFFYSDIGVKTAGYIPGFQLKGGPVVRIGISGMF